MGPLGPQGYPGAPWAQIMGPWDPGTQGPWEGPGAQSGRGTPGFQGTQGAARDHGPQGAPPASAEDRPDVRQERCQEQCEIAPTGIRACSFLNPPPKKTGQAKTNKNALKQHIVNPSTDGLLIFHFFADFS